MICHKWQKFAGCTNCCITDQQRIVVACVEKRFLTEFRDLSERKSISHHRSRFLIGERENALLVRDFHVLYMTCTWLVHCSNLSRQIRTRSGSTGFFQTACFPPTTHVTSNITGFISEIIIDYPDTGIMILCMHAYWAIHNWVLDNAKIFRIVSWYLWIRGMVIDHGQWICPGAGLLGWVSIQPAVFNRNERIFSCELKGLNWIDLQCLH